MSEKKTTDSIGFQLLKIVTRQFAIDEKAFDEADTQIKMSVNVGFASDKENQVVISSVKAHFEQKETPFLIIEVANYFKIDNPAWKNLQTGEKIILPKGFASHLAMLTIGTLRGALHCKTENTTFNRFFLPPINIARLIKEDVKL